MLSLLNIVQYQQYGDYEGGDFQWRPGIHVLPRVIGKIKETLPWLQVKIGKIKKTLPWLQVKIRKMEISFPAICMTLRHSTQSIQQNNPSHHKLV